MQSDLESWELLELREYLLTFVIHDCLTDTRPLALIIPSKSHPEVIVQAVAARDRARAEEFAKQNGIPEVKNSYQGKAS